MAKMSASAVAPSDRPALSAADEQLVLLRLRLAFKRDGRDGRVGRADGETEEAHAVLVLLEADGAPRCQQARRLDLRLKPREGEVVAARPVMYVEVERVAAAREAAVARPSRLAALAADVDRLAVARRPAPDRAQDGDGFERHGAVRFGADVEQVVAAVVRAGDEVADDLPRRLPAVVGAVVAPTVVHRHAGLPRAPGLRRLDALLGRGKISGELVAVVDDD